MFLTSVLLILSCKVEGPTEPGGGEENPGSSWEILAEGTFSAYKMDINGDTLCDTMLIHYPRDAAHKPGSRLTLKDTLGPGDMFRVFVRYEAGNDTTAFIFMGDTVNPGSTLVALAVIDTLMDVGDSTLATLPYEAAFPVPFYAVEALIDYGRPVCRPNSTDSVRLYYRVEREE